MWGNSVALGPQTFSAYYSTLLWLFFSRRISLVTLISCICRYIHLYVTTHICPQMLFNNNKKKKVYLWSFSPTNSIAGQRCIALCIVGVILNFWMTYKHFNCTTATTADSGLKHPFKLALSLDALWPMTVFSMQ